MIDLRSDTVTKPTEEMRKAMFEAEVGDDVYRDDPTVNELEKLGAEIMGKEASIFVPSGTFANQLAILTWTNPGNEIILGDSCHIFKDEGGGAGLISSVNTSQIQSPNGVLKISEIEKRIRTKDIHYPETTLICTENAHSSGNVLTLEESKDIYELGQEKNIPIHTDGARFINAAVSLNVKIKSLAQYSDSINLCLSKGLCSPIGSLLIGEKKFIEKARTYRKILGGGMRQVGVIGSAGIISLNKMINRLYIDHDNASYLGRKLSQINGINVDFDNLKINMVFFTLDNNIIEDKDFHIKLKEKGILTNPLENGLGRLVTHNDISRENIDVFINTVSDLLSN
ncbi:MAG: low-specificity L-threonine aldolase [Eubacteriales bacterium]